MAKRVRDKDPLDIQANTSFFWVQTFSAGGPGCLADCSISRSFFLKHDEILPWNPRLLHMQAFLAYMGWRQFKKSRRRRMVLLVLVYWILGIFVGFYDGWFWEWDVNFISISKKKPIQIWGPVIFRHWTCCTAMNMKYDKLFVEVIIDPFWRSTVAITSCRTWSIFGKTYHETTRKQEKGNEKLHEHLEVCHL